MSAIGVIESIWRYPVKSMAGEKLEKAYLGFPGVYGDRLFAFKSTGSPEAFPYLTARELPEMLLYRPRFSHASGAFQPPNLAAAESLGPGLTPVYGDEEQLRVEVETPSTGVLAVEDPKLANLLREGTGGDHALSLSRTERSQTDCRPLSLVSLQTVRCLEGKVGFPLDERRFRANLYLDLGAAPGFSEDELVGGTLRIGEKASVAVLERDPRCKMITLDPDTGHSSPEIMREVAQAHEGMAGIYCAAIVEGTVRPGDEVCLQDEGT